MVLFGGQTIKYWTLQVRRFGLLTGGGVGDEPKLLLVLPRFDTRSLKLLETRYGPQHDSNVNIVLCKSS